MPWHCPACQTIIRHNETDPAPIVGERYRCHVCRLMLEYQPTLNKLVITALETDHHVASEPIRGPRVIPTPIAERRKTPRKRRRRRK